MTEHRLVLTAAGKLEWHVIRCAQQLNMATENHGGSHHVSGPRVPSRKGPCTNKPSERSAYVLLR